MFFQFRVDDFSHLFRLFIFIRLSELHKVSHSRDKTLYEDRERRRRQMSLLERDVVNMPQEALKELFGPEFDLSNVLSPPTSLLDWFWGKGNSSSTNNDN